MAEELKPEEEIERLTKIIEENPEDAEAYFNRGNALNALGDYAKAIGEYTKTIELKPDSVEAYFNRGYTHNKQKQYVNAIQDYNKVLELNPKYINAYLSIGNVFYSLTEYDKAIQEYNKTIELEPNNPVAYNNRGAAFQEQKQYNKAIQDYNTAIELNHDYDNAYFNRGNTFQELKQYDKAIKDYDRVIELNPNDCSAYNNRGNVFNKIEQYDKAIQDYNRVIERDPSNAFAYNNRGIVFLKQGQYDKAIQNYNEAIRLAPNYDIAYFNRGEAFLFQKEWENAAQSFNAANEEVLDILSSYGETEQIEEVVKFMIDYDDFFNITTNFEAISIENKELYKNIYINVLQIIASLYVKNEFTAAHYTKRATAATLLFLKGSKFRLNSTITANDPQEGETLLKYLKLEKTNKNKESQNKKLKHDYQAFIGCFTFNHESLNQFRLYGKESDKEATGISLVLNKNFFNEKMDIGLLSNCVLKDNDKDKANINDDQSQEYALYRCIYVDPKTHKIISLGHKEEYSFYREFKETPEDEIKKDIEKYNESLEEIKAKVNDYFDKLSQCIKEAIEKKLDQDIICELLLPLRYLVKHVAYKEEQECRIFDIKDLKEDKLKEKDKREVKFTPDYSQMYINYQPITDYVEKIFFAPKTEGVEIFEKALEQEGLEIECKVSSHPFS